MLLTTTYIHQTYQINDVTLNHERILEAQESAKEDDESLEQGCRSSGCSTLLKKGLAFADALLLLKTSEVKLSLLPRTDISFLNQLLRDACAYTTLVVVLLFGIANPEIRDEFRRVVENIADHSRVGMIVEEKQWYLRAMPNNRMARTPPRHQRLN